MSQERLLAEEDPQRRSAQLQNRQTGGKEVPISLYAQDVAKLVLWLEDKDKRAVETVKKFSGFTENAYRYVFAYEDKYTEVEPHLDTILPSGRIENDKELTPEKERGIIAYTYSQKMLDEKMAQMFQTKGSPFVFEKNGEPYVMQTWPTKCNDKFKQEFELFDYPNNPYPKHFEAEALEDFKRVALTLFQRPLDEDPPLKLGVRRSENKLPMYEGKGFQLMALLRLRRDIREDLKILEILEPDGFLSKFKDGKGNEGEKPFHMDLNNSYCLYTKQGWETMACVKPLGQFDWEADRKDELAIPAQCSDDGVISFPLDMEWVSGPAYFWAWAATIVVWGGAIFVVVFAYFCYKKADWWEHGFFSDWWQHLLNTLLIAVMGGAIAFGVYADDKAMSYCIVPWLQNVEKSCMIPFFGRRSCNEFRYFSLLCTVSQMSTIQLNAWVLGNTFRNPDCQTKLAYEWLWEQSSFHRCFFGLKSCMIGCWCLSALQLVVPTVYTLLHVARRLTSQERKFNIQDDPKVNRNNDTQSYKFNCKSLLSGSLTEGVTLMALAAGMRYTGALSLSYPLATIKRIKDQQIGFLTKKEGEAKEGEAKEGEAKEGEAWEPTPHGWQFRCVKELQKLYSVQVKRLWFVLVFKYSFQMNTQVTLFIIKGVAETKDEFNSFAALMELASLGFMMLGIASELFDLKTLLLTFRDVRVIVNKCFKEKEKAVKKEEEKEEKKKEGERNKDGGQKEEKEKEKKDDNNNKKEEETQKEGGEPKKDGGENEEKEKDNKDDKNNQKEEEAQKKERGEHKKDSNDEEGCDAKCHHWVTGWRTKCHEWVTELLAPDIPWPCTRKKFMQSTLAHHFFKGQDEKLTYDDLNKEYWRILGVTISIVLMLMFAMFFIGYEMAKFVNFWRCPSGLWSYAESCLHKTSLDKKLIDNGCAVK